MECPQCGEQVSQGASYCADCGLNLEKLREYVENWKCPKCDVDVERSTCPECGLNLVDLRHKVLSGRSDRRSTEQDSTQSRQSESGAEATTASENRQPEQGGAVGPPGAADTGPDAEPERQRGQQEATNQQAQSADGATSRADDPSQAPTSRERAQSGASSTHRQGLNQEQVYCISCGAVISRRAEMCPECGMNQVPPGGWGTGNSGQMNAQQYENARLARKSKAGNVILGLVFPPIAYVNVGKPLTAVLNILTVNFFLLGFIIVPIHVYSIINTARKRVQGARRV